MTDARLIDEERHVREAATTDTSPPRPMRQVRGLIEMSRRRIKWQKVAVLAVTIGPLLGLALAILTLWGHGIGWTDVSIAIFMYFVSGFGVTVGFHRMLTHAGMDSRPWVRTFWASLGSLAVEGDPITWVADHRRHHAHSDQEGDPHSPHLHDDSLWGSIKGFVHAHIGWMINRKVQSDPQRWAPDLLKEPGIVRVSKLFPWFVVLTFVLPALMGFALTGTAMGAFTAFLWGGAVRVLTLHHVTWSTNSICHVFGTRPFDSGDKSTNNWPLAILSMGESWHNNHHAFPSSAVHGLRWWQIDTSAMVIRCMQAMRLVRNVRTPNPKAIARKAVSSRRTSAA